MTEQRAKLDRKGAVLAAVALVTAGLYQALWWLAPTLMAMPLWNGASIPVSVALGLLAIFVPALLSFLCVRGDREPGDAK